MREGRHRRQEVSRPACQFDLDAPCGRHFRYRDLIECGETWHRLAAQGRAPNNLPREVGSLEAMRALCAAVLDPLSDALGPVSLTYGFASAGLTRSIPGRIAPKLDQHAAMEVKGTGRAVCSRGGLAVDLRVVGHDSLHVARWICENVLFDRLYFYGSDRPLHVSIGPQNAGAIVELRLTATGRRVPRVVATVDEILSRHRLR